MNDPSNTRQIMSPFLTSKWSLGLGGMVGDDVIPVCMEDIGSCDVVSGCCDDVFPDMGSSVVTLSREHSTAVKRNRG